MKAALLPIAFALTAGAAFAEGPIYVDQPITSTASRAQVRAEAAEALRLGLHNGGEFSTIATPAQSDQIRQAGLRAVNLAGTQAAVKAH